uniref:LPS assembly protein LptD n=2 Tax=Pseudomonadota TaxID=1224 RepID=UPI0013B3B74E
YTRWTTEAEWKRTITTDSGLQITPILAARGDALWTDMTAASFTSGGTSYAYEGMIHDDAALRGMVTGGLEVRYPWLFTALNSSHVIEP